MTLSEMNQLTSSLCPLHGSPTHNIIAGQVAGHAGLPWRSNDTILMGENTVVQAHWISTLIVRLSGQHLSPWVFLCVWIFGLNKLKSCMQLYLQIKELEVRFFALQGTLYDAGSLQNDRSFVKRRKMNLVTSIPPVQCTFLTCAVPLSSWTISLDFQTNLLRRLVEYCDRQNYMLVLLSVWLSAFVCFACVQDSQTSGPGGPSVHTTNANEFLNMPSLMEHREIDREQCKFQVKHSPLHWYWWISCFEAFLFLICLCLLPAGAQGSHLTRK